MAVHRVARGFDSTAAAYERGRPDYPQGAVDALAAALGIDPGTTVVDLGAGTGKLTRLLVATGARVVAVEPLAGMRAELARVTPSVDVLDGTAQAMPLPTGSADAVVAAQAFHWFADEDALAEIHRVLRNGGGLGLVWNVRDVSVPWVARLTEILEPCAADDVPRHRRDDWRRVLETTDRFTSLEERHFAHAQVVDADSIRDRVGSISFVAVLAEPEREAVLDEVAALVAAQPPPVTITYDTRVYWCRARR
ncbi:MAG TPA: methyltransferase domain-containing protein [Acidimicrobiales bacterium]|nr:methyltransferase domain-containing protein [Acidimicrobiales bacterium]